MSESEERAGVSNPDTEALWADIDRAYAAGLKHQQNQNTVLQDQALFSSQLFQSNLLGILLTGDAEDTRIPVNNEEPKEASATNP
jgi:hypothetical protein